MREYLFGIIAVGTLTAVALSVSHDSMRTATRLALGVITLLCVVTPVIGAVGQLRDFDLSAPVPPDTQPEGGYLAVAEEAFCDGIERALGERLGIDPNSVSAECRGFELEQMRAEWINVKISGHPNADFRLAEDYVRENFTKGGGCRVELVG